MTFSAYAADLDRNVPRAKTTCPRRKANGAESIRRVGLDDAFATFANERDCLGVGRVLGHAGEKRVAALKAVNKASALQHVKDAIDGDGRQALALYCEALDQIVSADWFVTQRNVAKHSLTKRCPLDPKLYAARFRATKRAVNAYVVVMVARRKRNELLSDHSRGVMVFHI
jgi:hypothetical protein